MKLAAPYSLVARASTVALMLAAVAVAIPPSNAGDFVKPVLGYVWDAAGTPLEDADVTVNIRKPDTSIRATMTDQTDSGGQYTVTFAPEDWEIDDIIEAIAVFLGNEESNTSDPITSEGLQWVNVSYAFEIPEFGSTAGLMIAGALIGAVGVVTLVYYRKR